MAKKPEITQDEIDLGTLFSQIGKIFSSFFTFLSKLFKGFYHYFILLLLFLKKHILKLGIAAVLGAIIGFFVETISPRLYHYDMIVEPHYDAAYQINERIQYYNDLIFREDSVSLAKLFNIDFEDANSLSEFEMIRQEERRDILEAYNEFIKDKDSITVQKISFDDFSDKKFSRFDSKKYAFIISLKEERLKKNIQQELIDDLENNIHLKKDRKLTLSRLDIKEKNLLKTMNDVDSLRSTYKKVALLIARNKQNAGTAINISDSKDINDNDLRLFGIYKDAYRNLDTLLIEKQMLKDLISIITPLKPKGESELLVVERKTIQGSLIFLGIMLLYILIKELNQFLETYKKRLIKNI